MFDARKGQITITRGDTGLLAIVPTGYVPTSQDRMFFMVAEMPDGRIVINKTVTPDDGVCKLMFSGTDTENLSKRHRAYTYAIRFALDVTESNGKITGYREMITPEPPGCFVVLEANGCPACTCETQNVGSMEVKLESFRGPKGPKGETGPIGPQGPKGEKGDKGNRGEKGDTGQRGETGAKGDAFTFDDFTPEQLESLRGPKGDTGATGPQGTEGAVGPQGPQGAKGEPGKDAVIDATLTQEGAAADAKATGEAISHLKDDVAEIDNAVFDTTTAEELVNANPIVEDGKTLYTSTYIAIQEQSNSSIATLTNVVVGETLYISSTVANTTTSWGFTFTDDRNKTIYHYYDESLSGLADKTNIEVTVPEGATKLYVSRLSSKGKPEIFRKKVVKRKEPKSNLIDVLHGKKLVVFGDSMAYGHTIPESVWTKLLAEKHGMILTNFAQNGTTITRKTTTMSGATFLDTDSVHAKVMNNLNNPVEADYIIVFGGTNDIARNDQCPLGTIDDATSQTFYGALNAICQRLIQTYPSGNICFITPYIRNAGLATTEICKQYVTAIHEVCEKFGGIPVFDNTVNGALDFSNSYQANALTMKDSYHLNETGHKRAMHKYEVFLQGI